MRGGALEPSSPASPSTRARAAAAGRLREPPSRPPAASLSRACCLASPSPSRWPVCGPYPSAGAANRLDETPSAEFPVPPASSPADWPAVAEAPPQPLLAPHVSHIWRRAPWRGGQGCQLPSPACHATQPGTSPAGASDPEHPTCPPVASAGLVRAAAAGQDARRPVSLRNRAELGWRLLSELQNGPRWLVSANTPPSPGPSCSPHSARRARSSPALRAWPPETGASS
ncbi:uncharacterized protein LOC109717552 [Ananas comosus]|uniref:Uncharacterized protein LOC109717552 n=1 Tax=Ananas comosus TaxID=4615 RepID=A0A6P5G174_ANACO|nr:uncharacterized protein LOC109717552 [Ananas comosus]